MNYAEYGFDLINPDTLEELANGGTLLPYKKVDGKKDERWNTKIITSKVMQGMISGESIPKISKSFREVMDMNRVSSIRNARTTITSCENRARMQSMFDAESKGVILKKQWMATHDHRTRDSHREIDGETIPLNEEFSNGLMEPADPDGEPEEVYNCRCTMVSVVEGFDMSVIKERYLDDGGEAVVRTKEDEQYIENVSQERKNVIAMSDMKQGAYLLKHGAGSKSELLQAAKDGNIKEYTTRYFDALQSNGSAVSHKRLIGQPVLSGDSDVVTQRRELVKTLTGQSVESANEMYSALDVWVSNRWDLADVNLLDKYIDSDGTYDGELWRGLHFDTLDSRDGFLANIQVGSVMRAGREGKAASWSSDEATARTFASTGSHEIIMKCVGNRSASPIAYMNRMGEPEVLSHSKAQYTVLGVLQEGDANNSRTIITVIEKEARK